MIYLILFFTLLLFIVMKIEKKIIESKYLIKKAHKYRHVTRKERVERRKEIEEYKKSLTHKYYLEISKDNNGSYYNSLESNDNFIISYDNTKTVTNIKITGDNVSLDEIANLTEYSNAYSFLDGENILLNTLFCPTSSLQRKNLYSLSLLSSHKILSSSWNDPENIDKNLFF